MPLQDTNESIVDSGIGITLLYLSKSQDQGIQLVPSPVVQIHWDPAQLKLLDRSDQFDFLWKTSEPDFETTSKSFSEYAVHQYQVAEQKFSASPKMENFNTRG